MLYMIAEAITTNLNISKFYCLNQSLNYTVNNKEQYFNFKRVPLHQSETVKYFLKKSD